MSGFRSEKEKQKTRREIAKGLGLITYLGIMMICTVAFGAFIGYLLDKLFKTNFIFTLIFCFIGAGAAFRNLYYQVMKK